MQRLAEIASLIQISILPRSLSRNLTEIDLQTASVHWKPLIAFYWFIWMKMSADDDGERLSEEETKYIPGAAL